MAFVRRFIIILALSSTALAQQPAKSGPDQTSKKDIQEGRDNKGPEISSYRLNLVIYELEDGKRINQREYSMIARTLERSFARIGTRIPVSLEEKKIEYLDVGLFLSCSLREQNGKTLADFSVNISSLLPPDASTPAHISNIPILRNFSENVSTVITGEKPFLLASTDDLGSKRRTQIEVTAIKLD